VANNTERFGIENIPRGRPRSRARDAAILDAALTLMEREGFARMSMEAVAAEAGTTKATVYRRHRSKAELATAALAYLREQRPAPHTDDPRADLVEELERFRAGVERPHGMTMLGTVLAEEQHVPELMEAFRRDVVRPRRERLGEILDRCRLRPELDVETAATMLVGSYYAAYLASGLPDRGWARRAAEAVLASTPGGARGAGTGAGSRASPRRRRPSSTRGG
jgi:AcrR family transcriptional regulator